jgi:exopolyphosphatase/guanosine-5'-triphosphate,3'-diphosphate pyrophosphatase
MIGIDLGSNTLRVIQIDCKSGKTIAEYERMVKTADGLVQTGMISEAAEKRVIAAVKEAKVQLDFDTDRYRAVTTEAMRRAANRLAVIESIEKETGITFEIIGSDEEAMLTLLAVEHRLKSLAGSRSDTEYKKRSFLLVDIGGGSTELIFDYQGKVYSRSFPVGIVTVSQSYKTLEGIEGALPELMADMQSYCNAIFTRLGKTEAFVATAGTPTTIAAMKLGQNHASYNPEVVNGTLLDIDDLDSALKQLLEMSPDERETAVGVGRSDLISAGILIFRQLFSIAAAKQCMVIDDGLREGVALKACADELTFTADSI